ncbi:helix-turn-helix domain-containing protein [Virgibacillus pantothenticus]|uniref:helix-turn-helix domain-containing protein n=1 Tax=Virgibacillus pantothenticus TaxID=1473 RepID=UPI000985C98A|nr:helix-turn-helix domain-containing protein [Virgibacillus pantothenticus]
MTNNNELGNYIKELRGDHSIRTAAKMAGISPSYWSDLERGYGRASGKVVNPSMDILTKVANTLYELNDGAFEKAGIIIDFMEFTDHNLNYEIEVQGNNEYEIISSDSNEPTLKKDNFNYPINDLFYHLNSDHLNTKFFNGVPLSSSELKKLNSIIELFLESTYRIPVESYNKLISLVGKKSLDELLQVYNILKLAFLNKNQITSFEEFVLNALEIELNIIDIDISHAYQVAKELFNENTQD